MAGGAMYFAMSEADAKRKSNNGDDVVFRCELTMGRTLQLDHTGHPSMTLQKLSAMGYNSVKIHRNGDEYAVYEPYRVRILGTSDDVDDGCLAVAAVSGLGQLYLSEPLKYLASISQVSYEPKQACSLSKRVASSVIAVG